jgi:hypothetical protein
MKPDRFRNRLEKLTDLHLTSFFFLTLFILFSSWPALAQIDPARKGPFATSTAQYKFAATQDNEVLPQAETELWARVFWPREIARSTTPKAQHPILFFLHGNHSTCGSGTNPRVDTSCEYTTMGSCPADMVVVPNHEGYNYLAEHLASYGFIVVSINANRGITCGNGSTEDSGLNLARGRLILRHIQRWMNWSTKGGAPSSFKMASNAFVGAVDFSHVGLLGHSRGGEGVRAAYNLYLDPDSVWQKRMLGLRISGIYEIGAVDGQTSRVLDADNTAWNQLLPMCDGDVSDFAGRYPYERMILKPHEQSPSPKSLYMVWGANHNFFNSEWQVSDSAGCSGHAPIFGNGPRSAAQQKIAIVSATSFFLSHVGTKINLGASSDLAAHFDPATPLPSSVTSITRIFRDQIPTFDEVFDSRIDDFTEKTGTSSSHFANTASGIDIANESSIPSRANVSWKAAGPAHFAQFNFAAPGTGISANVYADLDFRVARQTAFMRSTVPTNFSVALVDSNDQVLPSVSTRSFSEIVGPPSYEALYQTVRIPLAAFQLAPGSKIRGVRLIFDQSPVGAIYLANIRFSTPVPNLIIANRYTRLDVRSGQNPGQNPGQSREPSLLPYLPSKISLGTHEEFAAEVVQMQAVRQSEYADRQNAIEVAVHSKTPFPVKDQMPILFIGDRAFQVSRYADAAKLDTLIFTVPRESFGALPMNGDMHIQYGNNSFDVASAAKVWRLPAYDKSSFHILSVKSEKSPF